MGNKTIKDFYLFHFVLMSMFENFSISNQLLYALLMLHTRRPTPTPTHLTKKINKLL